ncbi:MAG TPA: MFS transporter [Alphaproteobacteria bacterium]|nr:MFS transporter [Alphaproteobacteria bacterium]
MASSAATSSLRRAIIVCALGYFIDVFDIQLFVVLRVPSLTELGVPADRMAVIGGYILNAQMLGMIMGAFLWGWLGDRFGRIKALYGSILMYSIGTLACSMVHNLAAYAWLRWFTGFGLAGETGVAVTLIAELMSARRRDLGIAYVAAFGGLGACSAVVIAMFEPWRITYVIAGVLGFLLFVLRVRLLEPTLFLKTIKQKTAHNSWRVLSQSKQAFAFLRCVVMGLPLTYCWFLLNFFSAELSRYVLRSGEVFNQKTSLMVFYIGVAIGTIACGTLSYKFGRRRKALAIILVIGCVVFPFYLLVGPHLKFTDVQFYIISCLVGISGGGWALFNGATAESFGTNIRATTTVLMANFLRAFSIPMIFAFQFLQSAMSFTNAAAAIGVVLYIGGFWALSGLRETHGLDLDYVEALEKP